MHHLSMDELWETAPAATRTFTPDMVRHLPADVQRYFLHTFAPGAKLSSAVRIEMHGAMRMNKEWCPFQASQVTRWDRGFVWKARVKMHGLPVSGFDRWVDGEALMRWRLFGMVPVASAEGADIARAAAGRMHAEAFWLPAVLLGDDVVWEVGDPNDSGHVQAFIRAHGEATHLALALDPSGGVQSIKMSRWGDLNTGHFHYEDFGGLASAERTFDGVTLPTEFRVGWYFGADRFEAEGEFWRGTFDSVEYR